LKALQENSSDVIDIENLIHSQVWKRVAQIGGQRPSIGRLQSPMDEDGQFVLVSSTTRISQSEIKEMKTVTASQGDVRGNDGQFEILFWQSVKDSKDIKMYEDYLRKFPHGMFAELARINIQNLSKPPTVKKQVPKAQKKKDKPQTVKKQAPKAQKKKDLQASISSKPAKPTPVSTKVEVDRKISGFKLGVFPWKLTGGADRWNFIALESLTDVLEQRKKQIASLHTYYAIKVRPRTQVLGENYFSETVVSTLWTGSGDAPNVGYVRKMGKELKIDAVFLCNIDIIPWDPDPGTYKVFMVDVHSGKMYQGAASTRDIESNGERLFKKTAQKVISEYMRNQ